MLSRTTIVTPGLILLAAGLVAADDKKTDIRLEAKGSYTGNVISPVFSLSISGPEQKTWVYRYSDSMSGIIKDPPVNEVKGTYELADGLAIFTGSGTFGRGEQGPAQEVRFGVNHGLVGGEIHFDRLFPADDGTLRYRRQWYEKRDKQWQLVEERTLSLPSKGLEEGLKSWEVKVTGERVRWDKDGKKTVERGEETIVYKKDGYAPGYYHADQGSAKNWLPSELYPRFVKGKPEVMAIRAPSIGELRGLAPPLVVRPEDR